MPFDDNIIPQIGYPAVIQAETDRFNVNFLLRILSANYYTNEGIRSPRLYFPPFVILYISRANESRV